MTFYEALVVAMKQRGLRAVDLAERTGMHQSYFSKLKSGHQKSVDWEKALVIIEALGMTPNDFYELQKSDESV